MTELLRRAYDPATFRTEGHALIDQLADYLEGVTDYPANPYATPAQSLAVFRELLDRRAAPQEVYRQLIQDNVHLHHPDYMGHQVVPPAPLAALGDVAASLMNAGQAIFEMGRPGVAMEELVMERFAEMLRLAPTAGGFLTSGGTLANLTALLAARARQWPAGGGCLARWQRPRTPLSAGQRPGPLLHRPGGADHGLGDGGHYSRAYGRGTADAYRAH